MPVNWTNIRAQSGETTTSNTAMTINTMALNTLQIILAGNLIHIKLMVTD